MSYVNYGIEPALVERIKLKMKNPALKEQVKRVLDGVTKADLQDRVRVGQLLSRVSAVLGEPLTGQQRDNIIRFILAQRIDPNNTFHLLKLWAMFR